MKKIVIKSEKEVYYEEHDIYFDVDVGTVLDETCFEGVEFDEICVEISEIQEKTF